MIHPPTQTWRVFCAICLALFLQSFAWGAIQTAPLRTLVPEIKSVEGTAKAASKLQEAFKSFQKGQIEECFDLLQEATKAQANLPPARLMLARLFLAADRIPDGRLNLEQAAAENPDHPGVYLAFGNLALAEGHVTDAVLHLEKAAALAVPTNWTDEQKRFLQIEIRAGRAALAERRMHWEAARTALSAWLELEPQNAAARHRLGRVLFQLGKPEETYKQLQQAVKDEDTLEPAEVTMAWLHEAKGEHESAGRWMARAVERLPEDARAHLACATWLLRRDRLEEAGTAAEKAAKLAPEAREITMCQGNVARALGRHEQAEAFFAAIHTKSPSDAEATNQLALALAEQADESKRRRALELAEVNARQYSNNPEAIATLGWVHYRAGNPEEAERLLRAAVSAPEVRFDTTYYLARILTEQGNSTDAAEARKLLESLVDNSETFILRGIARQWLAGQAVGTESDGP